MCKHCSIAVFRQKSLKKTLSFSTLCKCPFIANGLISMINIGREVLVDLFPMQFRPIFYEL